MNQETYTPGHTTNAVDFMARRTVESHGAFVLPYLSNGQRILDAGCGPGTISLSLARRLPDSEVTGVDFAASQIERAQRAAAEYALANVSFQTASAYELPFEDGSFDIVFSHALLEHLAEPQKAVAEFRRVLKPGGVAGICSPDWAGFLLAPPSPEIAAAIDAYKALQTANGGDVYVGRKFGRLLLEAGFQEVKMSARYEVYESAEVIADYLARQLDAEGQGEPATALRAWAHEPAAMFAQSWVNAVGRKMV